MINNYFGIEKLPFTTDNITLLKQQQEIFDILKVHSYQGGLCLIVGEPGTGKTIIKESIKQSADKYTFVVTIARTLHTYTSTVKILCQAFNIDFKGSIFKCEKRLIDEAFNLYRSRKTLIVIIDDAHLLDIDTLRKLRLLFEDFPKNYNIILIGQIELIYKITLKINDDIRSRVTFSTIIKKMVFDDIKDFIFSQFDQVALAHKTFTDDALALVIRSADGILRQTRNITLSCMLEAVRSHKKIIDLDIVNTVLMQPHWRIDNEVKLIL